MRTPRLFLSPDAQPNAFATGRSERTAVVCVTEGLLAALDRDEVRGVVAHEVAHVRHRDILMGAHHAVIAWRWQCETEPPSSEHLNIQRFDLCAQTVPWLVGEGCR
jgi:Zn-dependent protease with chaperone function